MERILHPDEYVLVFVVGIMVLVGLYALLRLVLGGARRARLLALPAKTYRRILVPAAADLPIGTDALRLACRLAAGTPGNAAAAVVLAYVIAVPRAFALTQALPEEEAEAQAALDAAAQAVRAAGLQPETRIVKGRGLLDETLRAVADERADLLVLATGANYDPLAASSPAAGTAAGGSPAAGDDETETEEPLTSQIARRAPCEVVLARSSSAAAH